ncbi:hypothetical protein CMQ_3855 [Grosmannia clavigera kw1407]|uniref:Uncharacterized protein n=1 Tax=Grosmannia clavigera (strain kw1407 / UAMH 11150) TaxID=655863 RepID=F0X8E5_GROCL|nr:uncharacterized protein CMQ_3855 [Grosmannia clavigera kw1407]EFX05786.1 hypothetical protein CMQ_3855 [Grosmannia clavigera kw1407]
MNPLQPRTNHQFDPFEPHPELDNVDLSSLQGEDWSNPTNFLKMMTPNGMALPSVMTPDEVRREARERTTRLFADYHLLQDILERHEATVQRRWTKKNRAQKLAILLAAWPEMPTTHRPDFTASSKKAGSRDVKLRGAYMCPYINQEDLVKSKTLLLLLNSRGRNHPSVFAAADGEAMHLGKVTMALQPGFLNHHVFMLNGMTRDREYGRLVAWDDHEDAFDWMHTRKQFLPGEGLLIVEAQERLMAFLVRCCRQILHGIPADNLLQDDLYAVQPEPRLKESTDTSGLASLAIMAEEAPYRVPADLDLGRIEALLAARTAAAEDHAWALREDPGYFAGYLAEAREHRLEMLKDLVGNVHPTLKPARAGILWSRVIGQVLVEAHFHVELYAELLAQAQQLRELQRQHAAQITPLDDLPEPYLAALLRFRHYLQQVAKGPMDQLKMSFIASPPMRPFFVRHVPESAESSKILTVSRPGVRMDPMADKLLWLLRTLWEDDRDLFLCRLPNVVDELDRLLTAEPRVREFVSPCIARVIGDLSILGECLRQLDMYQPWANGWENALVDRQDAIQREFAARTETEARVLTAVQEKNVATLRPYGDPSDNKFDYPVARRRSQANVDSLRAAERYLDVFWAKADELLRVHAKGSDGIAYKRLLAQKRLLQRTPAWVERPARPQSTTTAAEALAQPLATLHLNTETPSARKELRDAAAAVGAKTKAKTRGEASAVQSAEAKKQATASASDLDPQPCFVVDARALKVFRIVFFDPAANTTPGEVGWLEFLHALQAVGFVAEKLYGSVWHFQPTTLDVERSIQFHEPHPRGKIPFVTARRHGRRLSRAYGWHGGVFVLKDKSNDA